MQLFPGLGILTPRRDPLPTPPPPPPTREDPEIRKARDTQRTAELRRRGRRATILTSGRGIEDELGTVNRPQARGSTLLGNVGG